MTHERGIRRRAHDPGRDGGELRMTQAMALDEWDDAWADDAVATIIGLSLAHESFSADDLAKELRKPNRPAQVGAAFRSAQAQGLIESLESQRSTSKTRNHGRNLRWRRKTEGVQNASTL